MMPKEDVDCADRYDGVGMSEGVFFFKLRKPFIIRFGMVVFGQELKNRYLFSSLHSTWS